VTMTTILIGLGIAVAAGGLALAVLTMFSKR
jgi:hypothetical protein